MHDLRQALCEKVALITEAHTLIAEVKEDAATAQKRQVKKQRFFLPGLFEYKKMYSKSMWPFCVGGNLFFVPYIHYAGKSLAL